MSSRYRRSHQISDAIRCGKDVGLPVLIIRYVGEDPNLLHRPDMRYLRRWLKDTFDVVPADHTGEPSLLVDLPANVLRNFLLPALTMDDIRKLRMTCKAVALGVDSNVRIRRAWFRNELILDASDFTALQWRWTHIVTPTRDRLMYPLRHVASKGELSFLHWLRGRDGLWAEVSRTVWARVLLASLHGLEGARHPKLDTQPVHLDVAKWLQKQLNLTFRELELPNDADGNGPTVFERICRDGSLDAAKWFHKTFKADFEANKTKWLPGLILSCSKPETLSVAQWLVSTLGMKKPLPPATRVDAARAFKAAAMNRLNLHDAFLFREAEHRATCQMWDSTKVKLLVFIAKQFELTAADIGSKDDVFRLLADRWLASDLDNFEMLLGFFYDGLAAEAPRLLVLACRIGDLTLQNYLADSRVLTEEDVRSENFKALRLSVSPTRLAQTSIQSILFLLDCGITHAEVKQHGDGLMVRACEMGCPQLLAWLYNTFGVAPNVTKDLTGALAVIAKNKGSGAKIAQYLRQTGQLTLEDLENSKETLFRDCCSRGNLQLAKFVHSHCPMSEKCIESHHDPSCDANDNCFMLAAQAGHKEVAKYLINLFGISRDEALEFIEDYDGFEEREPFIATCDSIWKGFARECREYEDDYGCYADEYYGGYDSYEDYDDDYGFAGGFFNFFY